MAGSFRIAEGYVEVTADESGYDRAIDRLKSKKTNVKIGLEVDDKDALARLDRLTRDRLLNVKLRVDDAALARLRLKDVTVSVAPKISDAAYNRVKAQLDRLTVERTVNIRANVDTRVGAAEIRNLTQRRTVRIGLDVDTRVAADSIANLTRRRQMTIQANADTADARARLDALTRDRRMNVRVDVDRSALSRLTGSLGSGSGAGLSSLTSSLSSLVALAVGALPTLASLGQSIIAMGPAAALAAPAVLSLGAAFAAIKLGTSGIGDAFKAAFAPAVSSGAAATASTNRVADAQRALAKAQQGVRDAEVNAAQARVKAARDIQDAQQSLKSTVQDVADSNRRAAESVASAERDLTDAQRAAKQAQLDLNDARKQAAEDLQDLNARLADAQLDQRQKVLDLQDAEQNLAAVKAKGASASQEDIDKAQLAYDKAVQNLSEQQTETARLQEQTTAANKAGVEGSKTVTTAKQQIADANQQVADKTQSLKDAEIEQSRTAADGAQRVAKAERDVADARAAAAKAAVDGARQIADAQASVADAARSLAQAQTAGAAATSKTADAMAKLAPNARSFVSAVLAQASAWRALKLDVQNALFAGLGAKFTTMSQAILPSLKTGLTGTAGVLNTMAKNAADAVTNLGKTGMLKQVFAGLNDGMKPLARIPGQLITGLAQISVAASPAFKRLTTAAGGAADRIAKKLGDAFKSGRLETAINGAITIAKQFGHLIGDVFGTLGNVMKAASAGGGDALGMLGEAFKTLRKVTAMPEVQKGLTAIFKAINTIAKLLVGTFGKALVQLVEGFAKIAPTITKVVDGLSGMGPVIGLLLLRMNPLLGGLMLIAPILGKLAGPISGLIKSIAPILQMVSDFTNKIIVAIAPVIGGIIKVLSAAFVALSPVLKVVLDVVGMLVQQFATALTPIIAALVPIVAQFGTFLGQLAPLFPVLFQAILPLIPPLAQLTVALLDLALQVITPLMPLIVGLAQLLTGVLASAITAMVPAITSAIDILTKFTTAVTQVVKWIIDQFTHLYDVLVGHSIIPDLVHAIIGWFTSLWTSTKQIFTTLKNGVVQIWKDLWSSVKSKWDSFYGSLKTALSGAWTWVRNSFSSLKTSITGTWSSMWTGAKNTLSSAFTTINSKISGFATGMKSAFSNLKNALGTIWDGLRAKIASPVKFVVGTVYNNGIRKMWNSIAGKVNSKITLPAIGLGFNRGGVVPGTGNSDTVPAMLTPGERILSKQQVTKLGGHRGIDAILGQDKPTKTGGNPSRQEERQRYQGGTQHFAGGGIVGNVTSAIGGAISSATSWAKDVVVGGLKSAAQKALSALVRPLINRIPSSGADIGGLMKATSNKAVDGMLNWFTNEDKKAVGGPAVQKALSWVKTQNGLPYQWAGNGNPSWDCSGLMSAIESVIRGEKPHRRWATGSFVGNNGPAGWVRNLNSPFMIGITNAGVGHTAGTLAGLNVESSGGAGVHMGKSARGYNNSLFTSRWGFAPAAKYDNGGLLQPGATLAVNRTGKPEAVLTAAEREAFQSMVRNGGSITIENITVSGTFDFSTPAGQRLAARQLAAAMKEEIRKSDRSRI
nr:hypothetical protein OG999_29315 [Streptomyces sp. NBC_00886]